MISYWGVISFDNFAIEYFLTKAEMDSTYVKLKCNSRMSYLYNQYPCVQTLDLNWISFVPNHAAVKQFLIDYMYRNDLKYSDRC